MITIYKYPITLDGGQVEIPLNSKILCFQMQRDVPTLWAMVDTEMPTGLRTFRIFGTGSNINENSRVDYIGTVQVGIFVWHCFEEK